MILDPAAKHELWFCDDCLMYAVNGDLTGLDYYLSQREADARAKEIEAGYDALVKQGDVFSDDYDASDGDSVQYECRDCGEIGRRHDFPMQYIDGESSLTCPECDSDDVRERDDGRLEFTRRDCDCCGTDLAGSRTRFALFPRKD